MIEWDELGTGEHRLQCPACSRGPKDRTLGVTIEHAGHGVAHCFRLPCDYVETRRGPAIRKHRAMPPRIQKRETLSEYGHDLWNACEPIHGVAAAYLRARECVIPPDGGHLRYHPDLKHMPSGSSGPALVALVTDAASAQPLTLHRTWIRADGSKAPVDPPRMLLGGHRKSGGVVRLWPDEAVTHGLGIAEGIETALSLAHAFTPVWACIDAGNLGGLQTLAGIDCLTIAADNDAAGLMASRECAQRWVAEGRQVRVLKPQAARCDLNDVVRGVA